MTRIKNRLEKRHSDKERGSRSIVENDRSAILDVVPNTVLQTAVALNELIYIGCENMEFGQSKEDYFDHLMLDGSDTFETRTLAALSYETGTLDGSNSSTLTSWKSDGQTLTSLRKDANRVMNGVSSITSSNVHSKRDMILRVPIPLVPSKSPPQPGSDDDRSSYLPGQLISGDVNVSVTYVPRTQHNVQTQDQLKNILENNLIDDLSTWSVETPRIEGQEKSIEGSLRSMRLTLKKLIRPTKIKEMNPPSEPSAPNENEKHSNHFNPSCALGQEQTTENEGRHSSRRFRRSIFNRKEQRYTTTTATSKASSSSSSSSSRYLENPDLSKKSSPRRKSNEKEHDNHLINPNSLRTRSILDRNKKSGVKKYSLRIVGRSVGNDSDNSANTEELDNDFSGPFGISILKSRSRSKSKKKPSLISRLRGLAKEEKEALSTPSEFHKEDNNDNSRLEGCEKKNLLLSPTHSTTSLSGPSSFSLKDEKAEEPISHVFLDPSDKGQEIAIQDDKYFYHDPAQIHSLLTLPTFDVYAGNEIHNSKEL